MEKENKKMKKSEFPEVIVGGLVFNQDGLVLLAENKRYQNKFTIPGGHVELGEGIEEAVLREIKEETNLDVVIEKKIGFAEAVFEEKFSPEKHYVFIDFLCSYEGEKDAVKLDETEFTDNYVWVDPEGALKMNLASGTERCIKRCLEEKKKDEYLAGWKRCIADFENYKKRQLESQRFLGNHAKEELILELLPVIDNFEASVEHIPKEKKDDSWVVGIMHIQKQLENILTESGVIAIETKIGDKFDPEVHEAIQKEGEKSKNNEIKKIVQKGYKMGEKIIRAVRVIVK